MENQTAIRHAGGAGGGEPTSPNDPVSVSVIVRSFNRLDACLELLNALLEQDYGNFEIIVVEQSTKKTPAQQERFDALAAQSPRIRVFQRKPLGAPGARNEGCRHARGEILVFIDDDDLPISRDWIRLHVENYADPTVIGVSGGDILFRDEDPSVCPYKNLARARRKNLSYSIFGVPRSYSRLRDRLESVAWLRGGNSSVRRSIVARVGGWDESMVDHEEHSFALRLHQLRSAHERLVFDPRPVIWRRTDVAGGLELRLARSHATYSRWFAYFHRIYARYHRARFVCTYVVYPFFMTYLTADWVWYSSKTDRDRREKILEIARVILASPLWFVREWYALLSGPRPSARASGSSLSGAT